MAVPLATLVMRSRAVCPTTAVRALCSGSAARPLALQHLRSSIHLRNTNYYSHKCMKHLIFRIEHRIYTSILLITDTFTKYSCQSLRKTQPCAPPIELIGCLLDVTQCAEVKPGGSCPVSCRFPYTGWSSVAVCRPGISLFV